MAKKELLWVQLARDLAYAIATGRYPVGTLLPKELDICRKTGLSRHTVRAALDHLQRAYALQQDPDIASHLGQVLWALGRRDEARRYFDEARRLDPGNRSLERALRETGA